ncbi:MAG: hypothetical protein MMC23_002596 [Stictis urceolatum]|nr:hypothetical protein [Stictis urceolata]
MVSWQNSETKDKLFAATIAALGLKTIPYKQIAIYFGENTTYNSIEAQFRSIRAQAKELKDAANGSGIDQPAAPVPRKKARANNTNTRSTNGRGAIAKSRPAERTSSSALNSTISGRVTKSKSKSVTPGDKSGENAAGAAKGLGDVQWSFVGSVGDGLGGLDGTANYFEDQFQSVAVFDQSLYDHSNGFLRSPSPSHFPF